MHRLVDCRKAEFTEQCSMSAFSHPAMASCCWSDYMAREPL